MIGFLTHTDTTLFLFLNSFHSPFWDTVMWHISGRPEWIPLYLTVTGWIIYKFRWKSILIISFAILLIILSDQLSVKLFKETFHRLRPCHNQQIRAVVHLVNNYCGGDYGFISNHASNSFALAAFTSIILRNRTYTILIFAWALLVSCSRIYLGVHYPGDILGGALFGYLLAKLMVYLLFLTGRRFSVRLR